MSGLWQRVVGSGSSARRLALRALVVGFAVWFGGRLMRSVPHDQVLVFPVGSVFPNAVRFSASWRLANQLEASGGVTLAFQEPPPLNVRQHASLPNGDYVVTVSVLERPQNSQSSSASAGVQTNIERLVTLASGETVVALAAGGF